MKSALGKYLSCSNRKCDLSATNKGVSTYIVEFTLGWMVTLKDEEMKVDL